MKRETWIQESLLPDDAVLTARLLREGAARVRGARARRQHGLIDYSRVTRDPGVALSHARRAQADAEVRAGLASAFARLSPEQRDAIRAKLGMPIRSSVA